MNISQNKSRIETCLEKLQKMFLIGISVDVKETDYKSDRNTQEEGSRIPDKRP